MIILIIKVLLYLNVTWLQDLYYLSFII